MYKLNAYNITPFKKKLNYFNDQYSDFLIFLTKKYKYPICLETISKSIKQNKMIKKTT